MFVSVHFSGTQYPGPGRRGNGRAARDRPATASIGPHTASGDVSEVCQQGRGGIERRAPHPGNPAEPKKNPKPPSGKRQAQPSGFHS